MLLLGVEFRLGDKHREVAVLHADRFDARVEKLSDRLPQGEGPRPQDIAPGDIVKVDHLRLDDNLLVPSWEVARLCELEALRVGASLLADVRVLGRTFQLWQWLCWLHVAAAATSRSRRSKIDNQRLVLKFGDKLEKVGRDERDGVIIAARVDAHLCRLHEFIVKHESHLAGRVIHHRKW